MANQHFSKIVDYVFIAIPTAIASLWLRPGVRAEVVITINFLQEGFIMDTENGGSAVFRDLKVYSCGIPSEANVPYF